MFAALAFLLVLVAGGLGGIALDRWLLRPERQLESTLLPEDALLLRPRDVSEYELARELRLTPTQQQHLDSLLTGAQARVRAVSREVGPRFRAIVAETLAGLRAVLTPEQREQLRAIRRERQTLRRERLDELRRRGFDIPDSADTTVGRAPSQ